MRADRTLAAFRSRRHVWCQDLPNLFMFTPQRECLLYPRVCVCVSADACLGAPLLHLKSAAVLPLPAGLHRPNPYVNVSGSFRLPLVYGGGFFF